MPVAEIFLSAFIAVLFERLTSLELLNFSRKEGIHANLKKWRKTLLKIQAVLSDAEEKQITDGAVKMWLDDLQDLAYDLDDILDDFATEALRHKLMAQPQASTSKVLKFISTCATHFSPHAVKFNYNMRSKIDDISSRLQQISREKNDLDLIENVGGIKSNVIRKRLSSTSLVESVVYGREQDKEAILEMLLRGEGNDKISVIAILGMGGVGKTTLAQMVYNDDILKSVGFNLKAWACVSDDFDVVAVTKTILVSLTSEACNLNDLDPLQVKLKDKLLGKKFLLVLDDIWNENSGEWDVLCRPFMDGAPGSKIIITTRNQKVALVTRALPPYHLKVLGNDDCLSLLAQLAFGRRNFDENPHLKEIGGQIVGKCKGLPLAVKTLGGLLRSSKPCESEWEDILTSKLWDIPEQESDILPALRLSYHHLPSHLNLCFAYCSIFPKDYEFDKDKLVMLWMAVGLLQQPKGRKRIEDLGCKYFDDLLSRSFFQQSSSYESRFVMHDLMNDLAQFVAGEICSKLEDKSEGNEQCKVSNRARHMSYIPKKFEVFQKFKVLYEVQHLQTFLPLSVHKHFGPRFYLSSKVLVDLLPKLQCLRVLSLSGYSISELPHSIGDLKHLRYLDLSETLIKWLPESVSSLYNMQTLSLNCCQYLCKLPKGIGNLIHLRHLDNANTEQLQEMPSGIGKLTNLQTLSKIVVTKSGGLQLKELSNLTLLRGTLSILDLQNVIDTREAMEANLRCMQGIDELELKWCDLSYDERLERDVRVLDMLQPHINLKRLRIEFFGGVKFPSWIGDRSFCKIVKVSLIGCIKCTYLPPVGQLPMLKHLSINGMNEVRSVGIEFSRDGCTLDFCFPSLETLSFKDMPEWEEWSYFIGDGEVGGQFPRLRELSIVGCPKLNKIHLLQLPSLQVLELKGCTGLVLKSFTDLTSLITLKINGVTELTCIHEEFMQFFVSLKVLSVGECNELVTLWQNEVTLENQLASSGEVEQGLPRNLEILELHNCSNMEKLPNGFNRLPSLRELSIGYCPKLVSFPEPCGPPMLRILRIRCCDTLESLPEEGMPHLELLEILKCPSLRSTGKLSTTLKKIYVSDCIGLESLPKESISSLEMLRIQDCSSLRLPTDLNNCSMLSLQNLSISNSQTLRTLVGSVHYMASLVELSICDCDELESFPERGLLTPSLRILRIINCKNLRSLPNGIQSLVSLHSLAIIKCPNLESFPNADLPPSLTLLYINVCETPKPLPEWGLHKLTSLRSFSIQGGYPELVSFPDEFLLPPALTYFRIEGFPNLESLSKGLQNLTSLERLVISNCPKLRSLPKEDLLAMLSSLDITGCPVLKQRFLKDKGDHWPKIVDIPHVRIDGLSIYELQDCSAP